MQAHPSAQRYASPPHPPPTVLITQQPAERPPLDLLYPASRGEYPLSAGLPCLALAVTKQTPQASFRSTPPSPSTFRLPVPALSIARVYALSRVYHPTSGSVVVASPAQYGTRVRRLMDPLLLHPAVHPAVVRIMPFLTRVSEFTDVDVAGPLGRLLESTLDLWPLLNPYMNVWNPAVMRYIHEFAGCLPPFWYKGLIECDGCAHDHGRAGSCLFVSFGPDAFESDTPALALRCLWCVNLRQPCRFSFRWRGGVARNVELHAMLRGPHGLVDIGDSVWWAGKATPLDWHPSEDGDALGLDLEGRRGREYRHGSETSTASAKESLPPVMVESALSSPTYPLSSPAHPATRDVNSSLRGSYHLDVAPLAPLIHFTPSSADWTPRERTPSIADSPQAAGPTRSMLPYRPPPLPAAKATPKPEMVHHTPTQGEPILRLSPLPSRVSPLDIAAPALIPPSPTSEESTPTDSSSGEPSPASVHNLPSPPLLLNISEFISFEAADDPLLLQSLHTAFESSARRSRDALGTTICAARNELNAHVDAASDVYFATVERACDDYKAKVVGALSSHKAQVERINAHIRALVGVEKGQGEGAEGAE
ncbi:hypothetical protein Q8F55_001754 [Vanrija albida]|uniref:Uncharacterized protein n=1 Tax=Vanrija albida TaxID=181172 RepID=A0ABR3Q824_9TREE